MRRETSFLLTLGLLSAIAPPIFAQDLQSQPGPVPPLNMIGPQLIAWSELQKPQPIPQPVPERELNKPDPNKKESDQKPQPATPSAQPSHNDAPTSRDDGRQKK